MPTWVLYKCTGLFLNSPWNSCQYYFAENNQVNELTKNTSHITLGHPLPDTTFFNTHISGTKDWKRNILGNLHGSHVAFYFFRRIYYIFKSIIDGKHSLQRFTTFKQVQTMQVYGIQSEFPLSFNLYLENKTSTSIKFQYKIYKMKHNRYLNLHCNSTRPHFGSIIQCITKINKIHKHAP